MKSCNHEGLQGTPADCQLAVSASCSSTCANSSHHPFSACQSLSLHCLTIEYLLLQAAASAQASAVATPVTVQKAVPVVVAKKSESSGHYQGLKRACQSAQQ